MPVDSSIDAVVQTLREAPITDEQRGKAYSDYRKASNPEQFRELFGTEKAPWKAQLYALKKFTPQSPGKTGPPAPITEPQKPPGGPPEQSPGPPKPAPTVRDEPWYKRAARGLYEGAVGAVSGPMERHPVEAAIGGPLLPMAHEAISGTVQGIKGALDSGKTPMERTESGISAIPTAGPLAATILHKLRTKDFAGLAGQGAGMGALALLLGRLPGGEAAGVEASPAAPSEAPPAPSGSPSGAPPMEAPPGSGATARFIPPSNTGIPGAAPLPEPEPNFGYEPVPAGGVRVSSGTTQQAQQLWDETLEWSRQLPEHELKAVVGHMKRAVAEHSANLPEELQAIAKEHLSQIEKISTKETPKTASARKAAASKTRSRWDDESEAPPGSPKQQELPLREAPAREPKTPVGQVGRIHTANAQRAISEAKTLGIKRAMLEVLDSHGNVISQVAFSPEGGAESSIAEAMAKGLAKKVRVSSMNGVGKKVEFNIEDIPEPVRKPAAQSRAVRPPLAASARPPGS